MMAFVKRLNMWIVAVVLSVVYVFAVGLARIVYMIAHPKDVQSDSYWETNTGHITIERLTQAY